MPADRHPRSSLRLGTALAVLVLAASLAPAASAACRSGYSYAGVVHDRAASGVRATIRPLAAPVVRWGHVAAWIGVGGAGAGSGGRDAWIQAGVNGFEGGVQTVYYEVVRPGRAPRYVEVEAAATVGAAHRLAVLELRNRPGWWRVWIDGEAAGRAVHLPGSHAAWQPMAIAESWSGERRVCNTYRYEFLELAVANRGTWTPLRAGQTFRDPGYTLARNGTRLLAAATGR